MTNVICAHGFGVGADSRGMFTEIAKSLPEHNFITFDFNKIDQEGNITVASLDKQTGILEEKLKNTKPSSVLLCHSQGCIVASMAKLENIDKVIFLAPPDNLDLGSFEKVFDRPGANINFSATSSIPRRDGTTTYVGADYIQSIENVDVSQFYSKLSKHHNLTIIRATEDDILGTTEFNFLENTKIIDIAANHNFDNDNSRQQLIKILKGEI